MENCKGETVLLCENSTEGILSAVYEAYHRRLKHRSTYVETEGGEGNYRLFAGYERIETDSGKVRTVLQTLRREFREEDVLWLDYALAAAEPERGQAVYRTIVEGRYQSHENGRRCGLFDDLKNPYIHKTFTLARRTQNELLHMKGFLRFEETENHVLYARIGPGSHILPFLSGHFADRFPMENFVIYDEKRGLFSVHPAGGDWYLVKGDKEGELERALAQSGKEREYQELFRHFCKTIAIEERRNEKLQTNMLPLRFREYMTEFHK